MIDSQRCILKSSPCQACYWTTKNNFKLSFCAKCNHAFVFNSISPEDLTSYYRSQRKYSEGYDDDLKKQDFPGSRSDAIRYLSLFQKNLGSERNPIRLLEVGAGWAYASRIASLKGWAVDAIEYSPSCVSSLKLALPSESIVWQGSFESFYEQTDKSYDAILMSQVLEHALDPAEWLSYAYRLLRPGGVLIVAVPQFKGIYRFLGVRDPYIIPPEHLNFFTRRSLGLLATRLGFEVVEASGYSRIPFYNLIRRFKFYIPSIAVYRFLQLVQFFFDRIGLSGIQIQVLRKNQE